MLCTVSPYLEALYIPHTGINGPFGQCISRVPVSLAPVALHDLGAKQEGYSEKRRVALRHLGYLAVTIRTSPGTLRQQFKTRKTRMPDLSRMEMPPAGMNRGQGLADMHEPQTARPQLSLWCGGSTCR
jgi:hypothetical protein